MLRRNQSRFGITKEKEKLANNIDPKQWYVLRFVDKKPYLYRYGFPTRKEAKYFLKINNIHKDWNFTIIHGKEAMELEIEIVKASAHGKKKFFRLLKYEYPADRISVQDRKSFRTKTRRWLRNWKKRPNKYTDFKRY